MHVGSLLSSGMFMQEIHLEYTVKDSHGAEFYLVEVIAMILKHLKEKLLQIECRGIDEPHKATDYNWVITVPAIIWKPRGKQMMRLAAYKVCRFILLLHVCPYNYGYYTHGIRYKFHVNK